jgi:SAM-dependent methyltransferase
MDDDAERIIALYERHAPAYDAERSRSLMERAWLDRFCALLPSSGAVLDIGCGPGEPIARHLIETGYALTGVDSSPAMIALCKARFPQRGWHVADMRALALRQYFNGVLAWDSFFHLTPDDQRRMFPIFRAHAAPKAALMFTSGPRAGAALGTYQGEPLYHASLELEEYRNLLAASDFNVVSYVPEDPSCGRHTIWLAQLR